MLKIYGDAPPTVSVSTVAVAPLTFDAGVVNSFGTDSSVYVNFFGFAGSTLVTFDETLYSKGVTPDILMGVPTSKLWSCSVKTVTTLDTFPPLPDSTLTSFIGSAAKAPTISNSGLLAAKPSVLAGNLSGILRLFVWSP